MELIKMIVTDSRGQTFIPADTKNDTGPKNLAGTHGYVYFEGEPIQKDPYSFWALEVPNPTDADTRPYRVTMVSPLGGPLSGLYRYPKIGEQVLVGRQGAGQNAEHFMLGYVPTAENPFNYPEEGIEDTRDIFEEAGELLRYLNTAYGANAYSEIGFRRAEKAQWPIEERDEKGEQIFPPIDVLTLDSAGNIRETAENHLMQKAARIELLVDVPEVLDRGTNAVDEAGTLPIGDYVGDDSGLHRGDLHIRAGNRVVIKADQEIRLQVGRTIVRIDDRGFNVVTKNVSGNYVNSYDTSLDMSPRNGIVLNGKSINLQAGYRLNMGDGMGATVAATMGNLNISGREISIDSYNSTEYLFHTIYQGLEYLVNAASGGMALGKADIKIADYVKYSEDSLESLVKIARKIFSLNAKRKAIRKERLKEEENRQRRAEAAAEEQRQKGAEEERLKKEAERQRLEGDDSKDDELDSEDTAFDSEDTALDSEGTVDDSIGAGDNSEGNEADPKDAGDNLADAKPTIEVSKATTEVPEATTTTEDAKPKYVFPTDSKRITDILDGKDHKGIDIGATKNDVGGDPVRAPVSGTVIFAGIYSGSLSKSTYIIIAGDDGTYHRLVHIDTITVKVDDKVSVGQEIAKMGKEGAEHVHLHYEVYKNKKEYDDRTAIDPRSLHPEITFTLDIKEKT